MLGKRTSGGGWRLDTGLREVYVASEGVETALTRRPTANREGTMLSRLGSRGQWWSIILSFTALSIMSSAAGVPAQTAGSNRTGTQAGTGTLSGAAQASEELKNLRRDVDALKESQKAIQSDLQELKNLLSRSRPTVAAPPRESVVSIEGAQSRGSKDARVVLVDFTDYQ
jgi:hypothetical protein